MDEILAGSMRTEEFGKKKKHLSKGRKQICEALFRNKIIDFNCHIGYMQ